MSNLINWIKAIRLPTVAMAGLLTLVSFRISEWHNIAYVVTVFILIVASSTMIQNDLRDRFHDVKKGKTFAIENTESFFKVSVYLWILSGIMALILWRINLVYGVLSFALIASGALYSEIRKIPFLPVTTVAITDASATLYPLVLLQTTESWALFASTLLIMFARECLKDFEDLSIDAEYKWTLPVKVGTKASEIIIAILISLTPVAMIMITDKTWVGVPTLAGALYFLLIRHNYRVAKRFIDVSLVIVLLVLLIFGL